MSLTNTSFRPVWLENGECPSEKQHFKGVAREVYGYLRLFADKHGGFVFASIPDITRHAKKWADKNGKTFSQRQCERILRAFIVLGILSPRITQIIHKRKYSGWQFFGHEHWTEAAGGICEFRNWKQYEAAYSYLMGNQKKEDSNYDEFNKQNVGINDGAYDGTNDGENDGENDENVGINVGMPPDVLAAKS